jgi:hypothetical protein
MHSYQSARWKSPLLLLLLLLLLPLPLPLPAAPAPLCSDLQARHPPSETPYLHGGTVRTYPFALCAEGLPPPPPPTPGALAGPPAAEADASLWDEGEFTLMTHCDLPARISGAPSRLPRLAALAAAWGRGVSLALRVPPEPAAAAAASSSSPPGDPATLVRRRAELAHVVWDALCRALGEAGARALLSTVDIHLLEYPGQSYNHNLGRTASMLYARTPFLLHQDLDFVPSPGAAAALRRRYRELLCGRRTVLVIPSESLGLLQSLGTYCTERIGKWVKRWAEKGRCARVTKWAGWAAGGPHTKCTVCVSVALFL